MKRLAFSLVAALVAVGTAAAKDLVWDQNYGSWWSGTIWTPVGSSEHQTAADGDSILIGDANKDNTLNIDMRPNPSKVVVDSSHNHTFKFYSSTCGFGASTGAIEKRGTGMLTFLQAKSWGGMSSDNLNKCPIDIYGGTLTSGIRANYNTYGDCRQPFTVTVHDGGRFWLRHHCSTGISNATADSDNSGNMSVIVEPGGVFEAYVDNESGMNILSWLNLNGGTFCYGSGYDAKSGMLEIRRGMRFSGTSPYVFNYDDARTRSGASPVQSISLRPHVSKTAAGDRLIEFDVSDISNGEGADVTFNIPIVHNPDYDQTRDVGILKTGEGHLVLGASGQQIVGGSAVNYAPDGAIRVEKGVLELAAATTLDPSCKREIYVSTNAELRLSNRNALNKVVSSGGINEGDASIVVDHGKFSITDTTAGYAFFGGLTLDHATFVPHQNADSGWGLLFLGKLLKIRDDTPVTWDSAHFDRIHLYPGEFGGTTFDIGRVPGDNAWDMELTCRLDNHRNFNWGNRNGKLVKQGDGVLMLDRPNNDGNSFAGDIEVDEGTLMLSASVKDCTPWADANKKFTKTIVGDLTQTRTFLVNENGTLHFNGRNIYPNYGSITNADNFPNTVHVRGKLKFSSYGTINPLQNLTIEDGTVEFGKGFDGYGLFKVCNTFKVIGTKPFEMKTTTYTYQWLMLNGWPYTTFDVANVTGDSRPDAVFETPLALQSSWIKDGAFPIRVGYVKKGAGTMVVAGGQAMSGGIDVTPNGPVDVREGCLQIDGWSGNVSEMTVAAGAYVSGSGTVSRVVMSEGAGFRCRVGAKQPNEMLHISRDLVLGATGNVDIICPDGGTAGAAKAMAVRVDGAILAPQGTSGWTVSVNGVPASGHVSIVGGTLRASTGGMAVIIR